MEMKVEEIERRVGLLLYEHAGEGIRGKRFLGILVMENIVEFTQYALTGNCI